MGTKQSAVEWYSDKLLEILGESVNSFTTEQTMANHYALKRANEIFKQQIMEAHFQGIKKTVIEVSNHITIPKTLKNVEEIEKGIQKNEEGEDYYNEKFNK